MKIFRYIQTERVIVLEKMKAEKFIREYTRGCSNELIAVEDKYGKEIISYHEWLSPEQALKAVELAREELIDRACTWLNNFYSEDRNCFLVKEAIEKFKQAMEEQL